MNSHLPSGDLSKYAFLPIEHQSLYELYKSLCRIFWTPTDIDFSQDRNDWNTKIKDEKVKRLVKRILVFFAPSDGIVIENIGENFLSEIPLKEAKNFYSIQIGNETIHNETYSLLIDTLIQNETEKKEAFDSLRTFKSIGIIGDWMFKNMNKDIPIIKRVIAFACIEMIIFSGSFAAIYWVRRENILPGVTKANELISRDEALHGLFAIELYNIITNKDRSPNFYVDRLPFDDVKSIITDAYEVAAQFVDDMIPEDLIGLRREDMKLYVQTTADFLSTKLGYPKIFNVENPFEWMVMIGLDNKSNFFETRATEYSKSKVGDYSFKTNEKF
jgi:ribonucleoside-diphosphate reductase beta chain